MTTQTDQPSLLDQLLAQQQTAKAEADATRLQERREVLKSVVEEINRRLGPLANEFASYAVYPAHTQWREDYNKERLATYSLQVNTPQLSFWIHACNNGQEIYLTPSSDTFRHQSNPILKSHDDPAVLDFFAQRIAARQKAVADQRDKEAKDLEKRITDLEHGLTPVYSNWQGYARNLEEAQAKLAELNQLAPDRYEDWQQAYDAWAQYQQKMEAQRAEEKRAQEERKANAIRFRQALVANRQERARLIEQNQQALETLAGQFEATFWVWNLEYALVATGDEGESYVDTNHVLVLASEPDSGGFWLVLGNNRVEKRLFYHLVSRSDALLCWVKDGGNAPYIRVKEAGDYFFHYSPAHDRDTIKAAIQRVVTIPLEEPRPEEFGLTNLGYWERENLYENLHLVEMGEEAAEAEGEEEPAF